MFTDDVEAARRLRAAIVKAIGRASHIEIITTADGSSAPRSRIASPMARVPRGDAAHCLPPRAGLRREHRHPRRAQPRLEVAAVLAGTSTPGCSILTMRAAAGRLDAAPADLRRPDYRAEGDGIAAASQSMRCRNGAGQLYRSAASRAGDDLPVAARPRRGRSAGTRARISGSTYMESACRPWTCSNAIGSSWRRRTLGCCRLEQALRSD